MNDDLTIRFLFGDARLDAVLSRALETDRQAAQLSPAFRVYYALRSLIPLTVRQLLQRSRRVDASPRWYFPDAFQAALVAELAKSAGGVTLIHPWPDGANFAFVPTHDVETIDGMRNVLHIADIEQELGFRSAWNIVPHKYAIDPGIVRELVDRGFEIGVHGYNHDGKLFTSRRVFDSRVPAINAALKSFDAVGFRAPMVHRNLQWLQSLEVEYDASCFDVDPYQAMPGGVGSIWPFIAGRYVELAYTLPQDHTLFIALGEPDERIWREKLDYLVAMRGMALVITHPDYLDSPSRVDAYRRFLLHLQETDGMWHALPREVAAWWRERDQLRLIQDSNSEWQITGPAKNRARPTTIRAAQPAEGAPYGVQWIDHSPAASLSNDQLLIRS
jgi:peptidoglycan/xylan/chitin deacetylase (PgdA/CDA1 family)